MNDREFIAAMMTLSEVKGVRKENDGTWSVFTNSDIDSVTSKVSRLSGEAVSFKILPCSEMIDYQEKPYHIVIGGETTDSK